MGKTSRPSSRPASANAWMDDGKPNKEVTPNLSRTQTPIEAVKADDDNISVKNLVMKKKKEKDTDSVPVKIQKGIRALWATRMTEDVEDDPEKLAKTTLRELVVYLCFLTTLCIITFGMSGSTQYYYTKVLSELFLDTDYDDAETTFRGMGSMEDFWNFAENSLLDGLYWEKWYNELNVTDDEMGMLLHENKMLGVPRMRMLQVRNDSCTVATTFEDMIPSCYDTYSEGEEERQPFGPHSTSSLTAWHYQSKGQLGGSNHFGTLDYYGGGGYVQDLATTRAGSEVILAEMKENLWFQRGTRAIFIDFTTYNANINLFCVIRLVVEIPATGGTVTSFDFRTVKLLRYISHMDYFVMAVEVVFMIFILYYMIEEGLELKKHKCQYLKTFWNILDLTVIFLSLGCLAFNIYRSVEVEHRLSALLDDPNQYADFEWLSFWQVLFNCSMAIVCFLAWAKLFKYLSFNKTMTQLSTTLSSSSKDLAGFGVMFAIIFFAFAQLGHLLFGTLIKDFSSITSCIFTLFRIILGDFNFEELEKADRILGPAYFVVYVFFVFFILLNMFLAIINDTYSEVKAELADKENEFEISDFIKTRVLKAMSKIKGRRKAIERAKAALKKADINGDKVIDYDEWRDNLKGQGYEEEAIDSMFKKYDMDGNHFLDETEQNAMKNELDAEDKQLKRDLHRARSRLGDLDDFDADGEDVDEDGVHIPRKRYLRRPDFSDLERRVDNMEFAIGGIVDKIDIVLVKLEAMEKAKAKRREAMANILNIIAESEGGTDKEKRQNVEELVRTELQNWEKEAAES